MSGDGTQGRATNTLTLQRFLAGGVALAVGASGHFHGHRMYLDRLNTLAGSLPPRDPPASARPAKPARRLWVVIVDGLRYDVGLELDHIQELARRGVARVLVADFPSFTYPGLTTMGTGVPPRYSGVRINRAGLRSSWDSVAKKAETSGVRIRFADGGFGDLGGLLVLPESAEQVALEAILAGHSNERELAFIYLGDVDVAGHRSGASSPEYLEAATKADQTIGRAWERLDPAQDALVVVSDHGHLDRGGHGGIEPEVISAVFVAAGHPFAAIATLPATAMRNLAPTLSMALGVDSPESAIGRPMLDAFGLSPPIVDDPAFREEAAARAAFAKRAWPRASIALTAMAAIVGALFRSRRSRLTPRDFVPSLAYVVAFGGPYLALGYGLTWSIPRGDAGYFIETLLCGGIGLIAALSIARSNRRPEEALASAVFFGAPYLVLAAYVGLDRRQLSGPYATYSVILLATIEFYACVPLGLRAIVPDRFAWKRAPSTAP